MRMGIDFHICCVEQSSLDIVTGAKIGEARETSGRASAVLKAVGEGDSLWSLAKHYGATTADIKKVNGLDSDMPVAGRLLLIPKKRGK